MTPADPSSSTASAFHAFGSNIGASSCDTDSGSTCSTASFGVISFSVDEVGRDHDRGVAGPLAVARLQHVQTLVLDRELEVLDVLVVLLEPRW